VLNVLRDAALEARLAALHTRSDAQIAEIQAWEAERTANPPLPDAIDAARIKAFRSDKFVALDPDKAAFCHQLIRAGDSRRVVEIGTSFGVSTLWLAAAVRDNIRARGGEGIVIGTEYEPAKAAAARALFAETGLSHLIDLREGDLRDTLRSIEGPIDFVLVDIWIAMARPALELVAPHFRPGAIVVCDNTARHRDAYADYFAFINDPANDFRTMTLPFDGGFEMSVKCPD
jgi:predicted O-methyltransferase YrrM